MIALVNTPVTPQFAESRHDIEMQSPSPMQVSFVIDEKRPLSSFPPSPLAQDATFLPTTESARPRPVRKYSGQWWHSYWDRAVLIGYLPRYLYSGFGLILVGLWVGITLIFAKNEMSWSKEENKFFPQKMTREGNSHRGISTIMLEGTLKNFDPIERALGVEWNGLWRENDKPDMDPVELATGIVPNTPWPVEIFRDTATTLWIENGPYQPGNEATQLMYKIANSSVPSIAVIGHSVDDSFDTRITFKQAEPINNLWKQPLCSYPFDVWKGNIAFIANDPWWDRAANTTNSHVFPLSGVRLTGHTLGWKIDFSVTQDCPNAPDMSKVLEQLYLPADYDQTQLTNATLEFGHFTCQMKIDMTASRPDLVKFTAVLSIIVNWTSTFFIFVLTSEVLLMRRGFMMSGTDLLGVTFTSLFALPSIRLLLPGAPEFGALIDLVGIIPNVVIISLCITAIAITKLNRKKKEHPKET